MPNMRGVKLGNEYLGVLGKGAYAAIPKAVFAAIAISVINRDCEDNMDAVHGALIREWWTLHYNGIVPQKPTVDAMPVREVK